MREDVDGLVYADPPACRHDGCRAFPTWQADTGNEWDPTSNAIFTDYLCGRHLPTFLWEFVGRFGSSVTLIRRCRPLQYGRRPGPRPAS